jgi:hypothetical protein
VQSGKETQSYGRGAAFQITVIYDVTCALTAEFPSPSQYTTATVGVSYQSWQNVLLCCLCDLVIIIIIIIIIVMIIMKRNLCFPRAFKDVSRLVTHQSGRSV